jgi:acyl-CoA-binding protein
MTQASLPQDVQLRLYACYKQATFGTLEPRQTSTYHLGMLLKLMLDANQSSIL